MRRMMTMILRCLAVLCVGIATGLAQAGVYEHGAEEILTVSGRLDIVAIDAKEPGRGKKVLLNGKTILEELAVHVSVRAVHPDEPKARLVLLELAGDHRLCPYFYKILEIRDDGRLALSERFGNCNALASPKYFRKIKANPVFGSGAWRFALAVAPNSRKVVWYEYRDGKIWQDGKPAKLPF